MKLNFYSFLGQARSTVSATGREIAPTRIRITRYSDGVVNVLVKIRPRRMPPPLKPALQPQQLLPRALVRCCPTTPCGPLAPCAHHSATELSQVTNPSLTWILTVRLKSSQSLAASTASQTPTFIRTERRRR